MRVPKGQNNYTDQEMRYILKSGGVIPLEAMARHLGRTVAAVSLKASTMGVSVKMKDKKNGDKNTKDI